MRVIGCLILWAFGALFVLAVKKFNSRKPVDYRQYPVTEAELIGTHDFHGSRWMARFKDETGREVVGADDMKAESTFSPQKYSIPKRGDTELVYYWLNDYTDSFKINGDPVEYMFHFCREEFYDLKKARDKRRPVLLSLIALFMFVSGILVLFFS